MGQAIKVPRESIHVDVTSTRLFERAKNLFLSAPGVLYMLQDQDKYTENTFGIYENL